MKSRDARLQFRIVRMEIKNHDRSRNKTYKDRHGDLRQTQQSDCYTI